MECSILLMGNTVEMARGDMYKEGYTRNTFQCAKRVEKYHEKTNGDHYNQLLSNWNLFSDLTSQSEGRKHLLPENIPFMIFDPLSTILEPFLAL